MVSVADALHLAAGETLVITMARLREPDGVGDHGEIAKGTNMNSGEPECLPGGDPR